MKKRYELGVMDLYPIAVNKTKIENNPLIHIEFVDNVDVDRLYAAVKAALLEYPLFGCTMKYDKGFYLETNDAEFKIFNVDFENRPVAFGDNTNGYLWQMCYKDNFLTFESCHAVSDGIGSVTFFNAILCHYFGVPKPVEPALELGLESFYDKSEKGIPQKKQEKGFAAKDLPYIKRGYKTDCHVLKAPMKDVLAAAKRSDASPAAVIPPLFSMALRKHIKPNAKNRNVRCDIVIDSRVPMKHKTMHNCIISKYITYDDRFDTKEFPLVSTIYRSLLDVALQPENVVCTATGMVDSIGPLVRIRPRFIQKIVAKVVSNVIKHADSNFTLTYLGKIDLPDEVMAGIADLNFRCWTDFGECNIAALDFKGTLILNICENYRDKGVIPDFIDICKSVGINFEEVDQLVYEQANLRMASI